MVQYGLEYAMRTMDLSGQWDFCLDEEQIGIKEAFFKLRFSDTIKLPATVGTAQKIEPSKEARIDCLTDPYEYVGFTWYSKDVEFEVDEAMGYELVLERTRISHVWIDEIFIGIQDSFIAPHRYDLTPFIRGAHRITIMVDNANYKIKGGHMTSKDTQTNWNGIVGKIHVEVKPKCHLESLKFFTQSCDKGNLVKVRWEVVLIGNGLNEIQKSEVCCVKPDTLSIDSSTAMKKPVLFSLKEGMNNCELILEEEVALWSEHRPVLHDFQFTLMDEEKSIVEIKNIKVGIRAFKAKENHFEINGRRTFLRGKHDGLIFPYTGYAPMITEDWLKVMGTAKAYGINHYRFHTCCPPEAAFEAADILGIYMQPELPFWGTVTTEEDIEHDREAQVYLIKEGYRILDGFGNHPSFVMMSLGNELWGSAERMNRLIKDYKKHDSRPLYTQGSNNFQFTPCILESDDFFSGVRFSKERLFRGSYAMCDAPQGFLQTDAPNFSHNYDCMIRPDYDVKIFEGKSNSGTEVIESEIQIQWGMETKKVKVGEINDLIPHIPVVSHEVGQYGMLPDYDEIKAYTGVLKARNFEEFERRTKVTDIHNMARLFFKASARFAVECYKVELEAALKSQYLAGFQLLDLQDFTGQGTALIGVLNAFMKSKGIIEPEEWRRFCSDRVILAVLDTVVFNSEEVIQLPIVLVNYHQKNIENPEIVVSITSEETTGQVEIYFETIEKTHTIYEEGVYTIAELKIRMPKVSVPKKVILSIKNKAYQIQNQYMLWVYPAIPVIESEILETTDTLEAFKALKCGKRVLLYAGDLCEEVSIEGTYCTDFWNYPMFRSISENMGRRVPVGTHGLYVETDHPIFKNFPTECYSTPQWYSFVTTSRALILDDTPIRPIVWTIDNVERHHRMGQLIEIGYEHGKLVICTSNLITEVDRVKAWLRYNVQKYMHSDDFKPMLYSKEVIEKVCEKLM